MAGSVLGPVAPALRVTRAMQHGENANLIGQVEVVNFVWKRLRECRMHFAVRNPKRIGSFADHLKQALHRLFKTGTQARLPGFVPVARLRKVSKDLGLNAHRLYLSRLASLLNSSSTERPA